MSKKTKIKVVIVKSAEGAAAVKLKTDADGSVIESEPIEPLQARNLVNQLKLKQESKTSSEGQTKYIYA